MATNCAPRHRPADRTNSRKRRSASCSGFSSRDRCPVAAKRDVRRAPCSDSGDNASVRSRTKSWFAMSSKKLLSSGVRRSRRRALTWSVSGGSATRRRSGSPLRVRSAMPCCRSRRRYRWSSRSSPNRGSPTCGAPPSARAPPIRFPAPSPGGPPAGSSVPPTSCASSTARQPRCSAPDVCSRPESGSRPTRSSTR